MNLLMLPGNSPSNKDWTRDLCELFLLYYYKFAMENPKCNKSIKITQMGLIIMYPDQVKFDNGVATLTFPPKWLEVPIDESSFTKFMEGISMLVTGPIPNENEDCQFYKCQHVNERYQNTKSDLPF